MSQYQIRGKLYRCGCLLTNKKARHFTNNILSVNYKINAQTNSNYANISNQQRIANRLILQSASQNVTPISRLNGGVTQFGNFYLKQPLSLNYLGRMEGQPGGGGSPPKNKFI
jgi:hypothetical protein